MTRRLESFSAAAARLKEALAEPESPLIRDAAIQRFEFCFELAWKTIQETARSHGLECRSPKESLRLAFKNEWIRDEALWLAAFKDRNLTSHTYDQDLAHSVYQRLPDYAPLFERLAERLGSL